MNEVLQRILDLLEDKHISGSKFCKDTNIAQSTFATWKQKDREPQLKYIVNIAEYLDVSEKYLLTGENELPHVVDDEAQRLAQEIKERPELMSLLDVSRKATREDIEQIASLMKRMTN